MKVDANSLNFSGGPGVLPEVVLQEAAAALIELHDLKISVLGVSHRSPWFQKVIDETKENIRGLLKIPEAYKILFLQGGGTQQFSMVPMLFLKSKSDCADYLETGYWSKKAIAEARKTGTINVLWSGEVEKFRRLPDPSELRFNKSAKFFHYVSNETVEGLQFPSIPGSDEVPRVCDMSSDLLSKPVEIDKFSLIYAHAQKNLGPAGVTVVILHEDLLEKCDSQSPAILNYRLFAEADSIYNTAPVFAIYFILLITRWMKKEFSSLERLQKINSEKADIINQVLAFDPVFFRALAESGSRSKMNICFSLPTVDLEKKLVDYLGQFKISGIEGHRSIGGLRVSLYNAMTLDSTKYLSEKLREFRKLIG